MGNQQTFCLSVFNLKTEQYEFMHFVDMHESPTVFRLLSDKDSQFNKFLLMTKNAQNIAIFLEVDLGAKTVQNLVIVKDVIAEQYWQNGTVIAVDIFNNVEQINLKTQKVAKLFQIPDL